MCHMYHMLACRFIILAYQWFCFLITRFPSLPFTTDDLFRDCLEEIFTSRLLISLCSTWLKPVTLYVASTITSAINILFTNNLSYNTQIHYFLRIKFNDSSAIECLARRFHTLQSSIKNNLFFDSDQLQKTSCTISTSYFFYRH